MSCQTNPFALRETNMAPERWGLGEFPFGMLVGGRCNLYICDTVVGSEIPNNHQGCIKPCKEWDKLPFPQLVITGFLPSTVCWFLSGSIVT